MDFQTCIYGSPAIDLIYLLYCVASSETRTNHREELIQYYHIEFIKTLKNIGYMGGMPTLLQLHINLLKNSFLEVFLSICFLPFMMVDLSKVNIEKINDANLDGENVKNAIYNSTQYQNLLKKLLKEFLHKGLLD